MKYFSILLLMIIAACSGSRNLSDLSSSKSSLEGDKKQLALEKFIDGSIAETKGNINQAIEFYSQSILLDPQPGIYYALAKNYWRINKLSNALVNIRLAVENDSLNINYLTMLANIYNASNLNDLSISTYKKIISLDSLNVAAYYGLAQLYEGTRPTEAIDLYKKVIDIIGPEWSVVVKLIDINERQGNLKESVSFIEKLLELNPSDLQLQKVLIDALIKTDQFEKAIFNADQALTTFPDDAGLIELKGNALINMGKIADASTYYMHLIKLKEISHENKIRIASAFYAQSVKDSSAVKIAKNFFETLDKDTTDWQIKASLGEIAVNEKDIDKAVKYFNESVKLAEWNLQLVVRFGGLLFDNQKYNEAEEFLKGQVVKFPNDFMVNLIYGLTLSQLGKHYEAKPVLELCIKLNPNDITSLSSLGFTLNQLKMEDEALIHLNKALILDPESLQVISIIALIEEGKKNYNVSDSLYLKALAIDPENVLILNNYAYSLSERDTNLEQALEWSKKTVEQEPENASYLDTLGWIYYKLNDYKRAKDYLEKAVAIENDNPTLLDHLGDAYFRLGDKNKAVQNWENALKLDPSKEEIKHKIEKGGL
jgi:tetratricopeptide (TPR) repeat protein